MMEKLFCMFLAVFALSLGVTACGDDDDDDSSSDSDTDSDTDADSDTDTDADTDTDTDADSDTDTDADVFTCADLATLSENIDNPPCDVLDQTNCECEGCGDGSACSNTTDTDNLIYYDCVCPACAGDSFCTSNCNDSDGVCNPYIEGCTCADCADHPLCL